MEIPKKEYRHINLPIQWRHCCDCHRLSDVLNSFIYPNTLSWLEWHDWGPRTATAESVLQLPSHQPPFFIEHRVRRLMRARSRPDHPNSNTRAFEFPTVYNAMIYGAERGRIAVK